MSKKIWKKRELSANSVGKFIALKKKSYETTVRKTFFYTLFKTDKEIGVQYFIDFQRFMSIFQY